MTGQRIKAGRLGIDDDFTHDETKISVEILGFYLTSSSTGWQGCVAICKNG
jgi:hypothetical protein